MKLLRLCELLIDVLTLAIHSNVVFAVYVIVKMVKRHHAYSCSCSDSRNICVLICLGRLLIAPIELNLTTSEQWFGQEQEGILPQLLSSSDIV